MRMRVRRPGAAVVLAVTLAAGAAGALSGCSGPAAEAQGSDAASMEKVAGQPARITLLGKAAQRIGVVTEAVAASTGTGTSTVAESAILYDPDGTTFVYTSPSDDVFARADVTVVSIAGKRAALSAGPAVGTKVVTVGAAELFGVEIGLGGGH